MNDRVVVRRYSRAELVAERGALLGDLRALDSLLEKYGSRESLVDEIRRCDFLLNIEAGNYDEGTLGDS